MAENRVQDPSARDIGCVFVIEDESLVAIGLQMMLEQLGYADVQVFGRVEDALERIEELQPGLVFMDIRLGDGLDGLAGAREVMERRPCPVIITTAYTEETYLREAMQSHVFGYLVKPVTSRQLVSAIALARGRFREFERLRSENDSLRDALETRKLVEKAKGLLMSKKRLSEEQAYELMRSRSQEKSIPMRDVARAIIDAADFL